jgi:nitrite reductase/ring-hydroxylating ferredoxin subunit
LSSNGQIAAASARDPHKSANFVIKRPNRSSIRTGSTQERKFCHQTAKSQQHPHGIHTRAQILSSNGQTTGVSARDPHKSANFVIKRPNRSSIRTGSTQERKFCTQKTRLQTASADIHSRTQILESTCLPEIIHTAQPT